LAKSPQVSILKNVKEETKRSLEDHKKERTKKENLTRRLHSGDLKETTQKKETLFSGPKGETGKLGPSKRQLRPVIPKKRKKSRWVGVEGGRLGTKSMPLP